MVDIPEGKYQILLIKLTKILKALFKKNHQDTQSLIQKNHKDTQNLIRESRQDTQNLIGETHKDTQNLIKETQNLIVRESEENRKILQGITNILDKIHDKVA
ncbi:MAG: hypothetical protein SCARUB_04826 [Candidatus Scalindua rubra]|uniref:Uncharacterized protein n=1 Tax=Candidatus Scalindua rubra TaxID=1872076 RepID=A0A1E3X365_9BACT|nr:MAG: hypothetical protein SCARUB_04826 [Candidatus Scalindua rubra]